MRETSGPAEGLPRNHHMERALNAWDRYQAQQQQGQLRADALATHQPTVPTATFLDLGTVQKRRWLGDLLMPSITRNSAKVQIPTWGTEHLQVSDTERSWGVDRQRGDFVLATVEYAMTWHGFEVGIDTRLPAITDSAFRLAFRASLLARKRIDLSLENRKALLLGETTNYAAGHTADLVGAEWDAAGGDVKADVEVGIDVLRVANPGYERRHMRLRLTEGAHQAAQNDPTWAAIRANFTDVHPSPEEALRQYLGIGSVEVADCNVATDAGVVSSMWGDTAFLSIDSALAGDLAAEWGDATYALLHVLPGQVFGPYFEPRPTVQWWPADNQNLPVLHSNDAAYVMHNVKEP